MTLAERPSTDGVPVRPRDAPALPDEPGTSRAGGGLLVALLALAAYAAFAGGAVDVGEAAWLQIALALLALVAVGLWAGGAGVRAAAPAAAWIALGALVALALWCALSIAGSVAPDRSWDEVNRVLAYALAFVLGLAAGTSAPRAIGRAAGGWVVVATLVALYALAGAVAPGLVDHAADEARLRAPLDRFGSLAAVCALAVPVAVRLAAAGEARSRRWWRLASLAAALLLVVVLGLTWSRSGALALAVGTVVAVGLADRRVRSLALLVLVLAAAAPALAFAWSSDVLTSDGAPLGARIDDGRTLGLVVLGGLVAVLALGWAVLRVADRPRSPRRLGARRRLPGWVVVAVLGGALLAGGAIALGTQWDTFTDPVRTVPAEPDRLTATDSGNRWALWEQAIGAWADHPVDGWGAGSFAVTHLLYRTDEASATHASSLPLDLMAEVGTVGLLLGVAVVAALGWAAVARLRAMPPGRGRDLAAALLGVGAGWLAVALVEPVWQVPGVTLPVLLLTGVLAARPFWAAGTVRRAGAFPDPDPASTGPRWGILAVAGVVLGLVATSALLPAWSDAERANAEDVVADAAATPQELERAAADARLAADLNPLSAAALQASASVAERRGRLLEARGELLDAVGRQPERSASWAQLAGVAFLLADRDGALSAARRALQLDPMSSERRALARRAEVFLAPPESSPTATGTPLQAAPGP
jgi:O-Antigen ligase